MRIKLRGLLFYALTSVLLLVLCPLDLLAATTTIELISPRGVGRGKTTLLTIEGTGLDGAKAILFEDKALKGKIISANLIGEAEKTKSGGESTDVPHFRIQTEIDVDSSAQPGLQRFRLLTEQGITPLAGLVIERFSEIQEREPNDCENPQAISLPGTLVGEISDLADTDCYTFEAKAGQELVFETFARKVGSSLEPVVEILDDAGRLVHQAETKSSQDPVFGYRFSAPGKYRLQIRDYQNRGGSGFYYLMDLGEFPFISRYFPIGVSADSATDISIEGFNLAGKNHVKVTPPNTEREGTVFPYRAVIPKGETTNPVSLVVGPAAQKLEQEPNDRLEQAQALAIPATVNGRISGGKVSPDADWYSFFARKGQVLLLEIIADRAGSPLDSVMEVLDSKGREIRRATIRCVMETSTISGVGSRQDQLSFTSTSGIDANDVVIVDRELGQVVAMSGGCEYNVRVRNLNGQRFPLWETTAENHAGGAPAYKVDVFPGEVDLPPNGLPVFYITARNDDGGPFYGNDSRIGFTAPADGKFFVEVKDARDLQGEEFVYQLSIKEAVPDFEMTFTPSNINVSRGAAVPITVWVNRAGGLNEEIQVNAEGLPSGVSVVPAVVPAGQNSTVLLLRTSTGSAAASSEPCPLRILGHVTSKQRKITRPATPLEPFPLVAITDRNFMKITAAPDRCVIRAGEGAEINVHVERLNGFAGDVSVVIRNLPPGVMVDPGMVNFELGNTIRKGENSLTLRVVAAASAKSVTQLVYVVASSAQLNYNHPTGAAEAVAPPISLTVESSRTHP